MGKVFVANPKKPEAIEAILRRNKDRLLSFLQEFHNDKDDEQFNDEKKFLIVQSRSPPTFLPLTLFFR